MPISFQNIIWDQIEKVEYPGEKGTSFWQTLYFEDLRLRMVTYSAGYRADHWCNKGHIVHCVQGSFISKLNTGQSVTLQEGQTYIVSDNTSYHLSFTEEGAKLFIIDGAFLANREV